MDEDLASFPTRPLTNSPVLPLNDGFIRSFGNLCVGGELGANKNHNTDTDNMFSSHGTLFDGNYRGNGPSYQDRKNLFVENPVMESMLGNHNLSFGPFFNENLTLKDHSTFESCTESCRFGQERKPFSDNQIGIASDYAFGPTSSTFSFFSVPIPSNRLRETVSFHSNSDIDTTRISEDLPSNGLFLNNFRPMSAGLWDNNISVMARNQMGSSRLQNILTLGEPVANDGILRLVVELMSDPLLLDICNEKQIEEIILGVTAQEGVLISLGHHKEGSISIQKLIRKIKKSSQLVARVMLALARGFMRLMMDRNGSGLIMQCLVHLKNHQNELLFKTIMENCITLATNQQGCLIIKECIGSLEQPHEHELVTKLAAEAVFLSQDPYGNYIVQEILDLGQTIAYDICWNVLKGRYVQLSVKKFSSHVVEKCIMTSGIAVVVYEFLTSDKLRQLACDKYGNFVIQSALRNAKGDLHRSLADAVRVHFQSLKYNSFGKKVLSLI